MDTILAVPVIAQFFLFMLIITSFFAGLILSVSISKAGGGWFLCILGFIFGVCIQAGCVFISLVYFKVFGDHVFMVLFLSLAIVVVVASISYKALDKYC